MIFTSDPHASYLSQKDEIDAAILSTLSDSRYILGDAVKNFENEFSAWCGTEYGVGVANGTDAIEIALRALSIQQGDEVITVSHTAVATACGIARSGGKPVFVDIDPDTYTMDPAKIEREITQKTKAIVVVHLYGHPADMQSIMAIARKYGLYVIEDCAQAHGASINGLKVGSFGDAASFSFYPTKNLGAIGDGGMVITGKKEVSEFAIKLRQYGWDDNQVSQCQGLNSRLDEIQAAILLAKLKNLNVATAKRIENAELYYKELNDLPVKLPKRRDGIVHVYHQFVIETEERERVMAHLKENDILAGIHYAVPVHQHPAYEDETDLPVTETAIKKIISLPVYPELPKDSIMTVIDTLRGTLTT